ncbi:MAG: GNAT family N-acetyltransferase, partial [Candidatus Hodarchaeales archaeon]
MTNLRTSTEEERDKFFEMMRAELTELEHTGMDLQFSWESLEQKFKMDGEIRAIITDTNDVTGFIWIEHHPPTLYIQSMILLPMFRGHGIGNDVFQKLEEEFRQTTNEMIIGTLEGNEAAIRFYKRVGFVPMKDSP